MKVRTLISLAAIGLLGSCGSNTKDTAVPLDSKLTKSEPAACTSTVPAGASNCLLDLGGGTDSYWADTDGVDPGTAGCHEEFETSTCETVKSGRTFGELCLDEDRLVESNPGKNECHTHGGDKGKPDVVSCAAWCKENGSSAGRCESGVEAPASGGTCQSARCVCDA